jgi:hypothetical protein
MCYGHIRRDPQQQKKQNKQKKQKAWLPQHQDNRNQKKKRPHLATSVVPTG